MFKDLNHLEIAWQFVQILNVYLIEWDNIPVMNFNFEHNKVLTDDLKSRIIEFDQKLKVNNVF